MSKLGSSIRAALLASSLSMLAVLPQSVQASDVLETTQIPAGIKDSLLKILPDNVPYTVQSSPMKGLYQINVGMDVVFMSEDGSYMLNGALIDVASRENLTETARAALRLDTLAKVPEKGLITYAGNSDGALNGRKITVFTDVDCPYCKKLHAEVPELNKAGIEVRYMAFPRKGVASSTYEDMTSIWCAKDPAKALDSAMSATGSAPAPKKCNHPIQDHMMFAQMFGVNGTPNIILDTGEMLPGYVPAKELIKSMSVQ